MDLVVSAAMNKNVVAASASMDLEELRSLFVEHGFSGYPVVDDGVLVGVVTTSDLIKVSSLTDSVTTSTHSDRELRRALVNPLGNVALQKSVGDIMTHDVITVSPQDYLRDAADLMYKNRIHRVFVVKDMKLVGVLSPFDFVRLYVRNRLIAGFRPPARDF